MYSERTQHSVTRDTFRIGKIRAFLHSLGLLLLGTGANPITGFPSTGKFR
jgi:hypothetical protein